MADIADKEFTIPTSEPLTFGVIQQIHEYNVANVVRPTVTVTQQPTSSSVAWKATLNLTFGALSRMVVFVTYPDLGSSIVAFDGSSFTPDFNGASALVSNDITGTYQITIIPNGGWVASPTIYVHTVSDTGGVNAA